MIFDKDLEKNINNGILEFSGNESHNGFLETVSDLKEMSLEI